MSLQVCPCGWSKVTTYKGLRIHQGKMGCLPMGTRIPGSEQSLLESNGNQAKQKDSGPDISALITDGPESDGPPCQTDQSERDRRELDSSPRPQVESSTSTPQETGSQKKEAESGGFSKEQARLMDDFQQDLQRRKKRVDQITVSVKDCEHQLDSECREIQKAFEEVMSAVEEARLEALKPLEERRRRLKEEEEPLVRNLQREINHLEKMMSELNNDSTMQATSSLTDLDGGSDLNNMCVDTCLSFGTLRTTMSTMMERIEQELEQLSSVELKRIPKFTVDMMLDPKTAHKHLLLSDDRKQVSDGGRDSLVPDGPERFSLFAGVLGLNQLSSGRSYWEVEVGKKTGWSLGVTGAHAARKGKLSINHASGFWVVDRYDGGQYAALTVPPTRLSLESQPQRVGVFVDYEEGLVSFYDVGAASHLYSFTKCLFPDQLYPYFSPHF